LQPFIPMKNLLPTLLIALVLVACESKPAPQFQGTLYFGQGAYVMGFSLQDASLALVGRIGDAEIRRIEAMGPDYLLIAATGTVNQSRVSRISWYDLKTGEIADLYPGALARYLADPAIVVYDDGHNLYSVPRQDRTENRVIYAHSDGPVSRLLEAHPGLLLFEAGQGAAAVIHAWESATDELRSLEALTATCRLEGAVWIAEIGRLACQPRSEADTAYVLSDLEGRVEAPLALPEGRRFEALAFIPAQHILVLRETRRGRISSREQHAVWVYDIRTGTPYELARDVDLGSSVVYAEY